MVWVRSWYGQRTHWNVTLACRYPYHRQSWIHMLPLAEASEHRQHLSSLVTMGDLAATAVATKFWFHMSACGMDQTGLSKFAMHLTLLCIAGPCR